VVGLAGRKKFDDIFIRFDTIPECDRQTSTLLRQRPLCAMHRAVKTTYFIERHIFRHGSDVKMRHFLYPEKLKESK